MLISISSALKIHARHLEYHLSDLGTFRLFVNKCCHYSLVFFILEQHTFLGLTLMFLELYIPFLSIFCQRTS